MAVKESTEFDLDCKPSVVMDLLLDIAALPDWSSSHKEAEVLEEDEQGYPRKVRVKVSALGFTDEQVLAYSWTDTVCRWELIESGQMKSQIGSYTVTPRDGGCHVAFEIEVELKIMLPGFVVRKGQKLAVETARKGLTDEINRRIAL